MFYALSIWDYNENKLIDLKSENISILGQAHSARRKQNINGLDELEFVLPLYFLDEDGNEVENFRWSYIQAESLIRLDYKGYMNWYIVKTFDEVRDNNGYLLSNVQCKHISNLLTQSGLDLYLDEEVGTAHELLKKILDDSGWEIGVVDKFLNKDGTEKIRTISLERSNRYSAIQDLAELFGGYPVFNPNKTVDIKLEVGINNGVEFRNGKNLKNVSRTIGNSDLITKLWVEGGSDEVGIVTISDVNPTGENYILNFGYFINGGFLTEEQIDAIEDFETQIPQLNANIMSVLNGGSELYNTKSTLEVELESKRLFLAAKTQAVEEKTEEIANEKDNAKKQNLINIRSTLQSEISVLNDEISILQSRINGYNAGISDNEGLLNAYFNDKKILLDNFNSILKDFIREGLWQDSNYVDPFSLYEDALEQSMIYAYPQVSYDIGVLDLSVLTGYEVEEFRIGDIIRLIDDRVRIDTLGRITEIEIPLEYPQDTTVKMGNYFSNFEDLFKKVTQSAEIIKQRQQVYERATGINPDGSIDYELLQNTFNNHVFSIVGGTNKSVANDERGIVSNSLEDPNDMLRLSGGILYGSTNGGASWRPIITSQGISGLNITSGIIGSGILPLITPDKTSINFGNELDISANENITIKVGKDEIIGAINLSPEELVIDVNKISLIGETNIEEAAISTAKIQDASITNAKIDRASVDKLVVVSADIEDAAITTVKIQDASITNAKIDRVSANKLVVTNADIEEASIDSAKIQDAAIGTAHIQTGAITTALIGEGVIGTAQIADVSITDAKIVGVTANKITAGTIDAAEIEVINLHAANITVGTINGYQIAQNAIDVEHLVNGAVTEDKLSTELTSQLEQNRINVDTALQEVVDLESSFTTFETNTQDQIGTLANDVVEIDNKKMITVKILSSEGMALKETVKQTTLEARVYNWHEDITDLIPANKFNWKRQSLLKVNDEYWNMEYGAGRKKIVITTDDVRELATFECEVDID